MWWFGIAVMVIGLLRKEVEGVVVGAFIALSEHIRNLEDRW